MTETDFRASIVKLGFEPIDPAPGLSEWAYELNFHEHLGLETWKTSYGMVVLTIRDPDDYEAVVGLYRGTDLNEALGILPAFIAAGRNCVHGTVSA
jgi:hypothetical protein